MDEDTTCGLRYPHEFLQPRFAPLQVFMVGALVFVGSVLLLQVEGRVGKARIDAVVFNGGQHLQAIANGHFTKVVFQHRQLPFSRESLSAQSQSLHRLGAENQFRESHRFQSRNSSRQFQPQNFQPSYRREQSDQPVW